LQLQGVEVSTQLNSTQFTKNQYKQQNGLGVKSGFQFLQFQYYWIPTGIYPVLKYRLGTKLLNWFVDRLPPPPPPRTGRSPFNTLYAAIEYSAGHAIV
jgi:hypothetical protein